MLKTISRLAGSFAQSNFSRKFIPFYASFFQIALEDAEKPLGDFKHLTDFFTRALKPGLRPIFPEPNAIVSPVDGRVSQFGEIKNGMLIQAKGVDYKLTDLLGGDTTKAERFLGGTFLTIYLSPKDYHRIHTPLAGKLTDYAYIPGSLFPVNNIGVKNVKGLFARNERIITYMDTTAGEIAVIKVGATIVGSVRVVYDTNLTTNVKGAAIGGKIKNSPVLTKGAELGHFAFGSTVILLFEAGKVKLNLDLKEQDVVRMGEKIGEVNQAV